jgi:hypothetical protein
MAAPFLRVIPANGKHRELFFIVFVFGEHFPCG